MASSLQNLSHYNEENMPSAEALSFGIVVSEWNQHITHALYEGCRETLIKHGVKEENIHTLQVPGSFELPLGGKWMADNHKVDAVICLGCVIQGETRHNEYINQSVSTGLTNLSLFYARPFIFGLLTPNDEQQALDRAGGKHGNKGVEAATTAIRMAALKKGFKAQKQNIGFQ
ncbi:MAG TPA: 6,7-dimethyl-8-ribityllumazine synthase [Saprospiraceae bacterium]|nr:6,7-dimethyl-8-ribityllumazine synthase [Saprospiraceae bacterium]HMQ84311.1 6,7-dimethyl-8-ribityllumazine synthase [Saprospiraceae bacterium]